MDRPQRLVFGAVADAYDVNRPGYPAAMFDDLVARASDGRGLVAADIGCGTGRVAVALAERGVTGIGIEPDEAMAEVARRRLAGTGWTVQVSDFERAALAEASAHLVTAGQAWHWVDPDLGLDKARHVLAPGGWLALFWNRFEWSDDALRADLDGVYARLAPTMESSIGKKGTPPKGRPPLDGAAPEGFSEVSLVDHHHAVRYTTEQWVGLLGTHSDHVMLDPQTRIELHAAVADVIDGHGGAIDVRYRTECWSARRRA